MTSFSANKLGAGLVDHGFLIRVTSADGVVVFEDTDFAATARFEWFAQVVREVAESGECVELVERETGHVIETELRKATDR